MMNCVKEYSKVIVVGDFNINVNNQVESQQLLDYMRKYGLSLINNIGEMSNNGNTQIDLLFSTDVSDSIPMHWYESYFSYHKPLWFSIKGSLSLENLRIK